MENKIKVHFQRFEFKYQIPLNQVEGMIPEFLKYMEFDSYSLGLPDNAYDVISLYYDTFGLGCYYDKIAGVRNRKKLRIRTYEPDVQLDSSVFLEIKKKYDTVVVKDRLKINYKDALGVIDRNIKPGGIDNHDQQTLNEFLWIKNKNAMVPQNMVVYKRKPLMSKVDKDFRVTIDYDIRTYLANSLTDRGREELVNPGMAILELKFNNVLPFWFHRIIQKYGLQQRPFSKYCSGLEICRPLLIDDQASDYYQKQLIIT